MPRVAAAQEPGLARNIVWVEGGGLYAFAQAPAGVTYEHLLASRTYLRAGISAMPRESFEGQPDGTSTTRTRVVVPLPVTVAYLVGRGSHFLELGAGGMVILDPDETEFGPAGTIHYRIQGARESLAFRVGLSFFIEQDDWSLYPWPGLSFGFAF